MAAFSGGSGIEKSAEAVDMFLACRKNPPTSAAGLCFVRHFRLFYALFLIRSGLIEGPKSGEIGPLARRLKLKIGCGKVRRSMALSRHWAQGAVVLAPSLRGSWPVHSG